MQPPIASPKEAALASDWIRQLNLEFCGIARQADNPKKLEASDSVRSKLVEHTRVSRRHVNPIHLARSRLAQTYSTMAQAAQGPPVLDLRKIFG